MPIDRYARVLGEQRETVTKDVVARYRKKESIRDIAAALGRSYGFVHKLLAEANMTMRARGGSGRAKRRSP